MLLLLLWILVFWVCSNLFEDERLSRAALWALVAGCLVRSAMPIVGIGTTAREQGLGGARVTVLGQGPNQSAQVLAVGLLALIGMSYVQLGRPGRGRWIAWAGVGLITTGLVATGSRGGLLTFAAGLLVTLVAGRSLRVRIRNAAVVLLAAAVLAVAFSRSDLLQRRFSAAVDEGDLSGRETIYPFTVDMCLEKPLLGWGPITNKYELGSRLNDPTRSRRDAHNAVLEILTASGLAGLIPFTVGAWLCFRSAWRSRAGPRGALPLTLVVAVVMVNMSGNRLTAPVTWLMLAYGLTSRAGRAEC
jgi:O-antigen ligase